MPRSITIELPDEIRDELTARAAVCGRSLEQYIESELNALAQRPSAAVWMARVRAKRDALQQSSTCASQSPLAEQVPDSQQRDVG
jgi:hypothetical protein